MCVPRLQQDEMLPWQQVFTVDVINKVVYNNDISNN